MNILYLFSISIIVSGSLYPVFALDTPQVCDANSLPHYGPHNPSHIYIKDTSGNLPYIPLTDHTSILHDDDVWNTYPEPRTIQVTLTIHNQDTGQLVFNQTQSLQMQACSGPESIKWRFVPIQVANYIATISDDRDKENMIFNSMLDATKSQTVSSPLEQLRFGIDSHSIVCKQDLQLVIKSEDGSPACVKPDTKIQLLKIGWTVLGPKDFGYNPGRGPPAFHDPQSNETNQTMMIGTDVYDVREFQPIAGNAVYLDDLKFIYQGRSSLNDSCYPEIVNQTQARDFEIVSNEADFNSHSCWPPSNYPQNITKQNVLPSDLFSRYSIIFFNNQTMGIGLCHVDSCEFGKMIYLAKRGWDTPIVYDSVSNLEFHLFTNASTISIGQSIGINMSTINKAQNTIIVPNKYDFSFNGTGLGPCYYGPFELEILGGYFDENNFTHGAELHLYQPGIYSCPAPEGAKGYKFEPSSDTSMPRCSPFNYCNSTEQMRDRVSFSGYWNDTSFHKFESGMYTIIAGDEWGNHSIRYFTVTR